VSVVTLSPADAAARRAAPVPSPAAPSAAAPAPATASPEQELLWTVTVDHGGDLLDDELDANGLDRLVGELGGRVVAVSHRPRRFTTTVRLHGPDALAAADRAARLVGDAARAVGLPAWPLVHLEVERRG
jgi:hypothetical protein